MQAPTTRGPAQGPRPTSSIPRMDCVGGVLSAAKKSPSAGDFPMKLSGCGNFFLLGGWLLGLGGFGEGVDGDTVEIFTLEAGGLTRALAEVSKVVTADFGTLDNLDFLNQGAVEQERFLDADARGDLANGDASSVGLFASDAEDYAFEDLETELLTFFNFLGNFDGVARADINNGMFLLGFTNLLQDRKTHIIPLLVKTCTYFNTLCGKMEDLFR